MIYKSCSRCGKLHPKGYVCNVGRTYNGGEERTLRRKNAWKEKSEEIRERSRYLCAVCEYQGRYTYTGLEVHHIEKLKDREDLFLEDTNLVCLCTEHHKEADAGKISKEFLKTLVKLRDGADEDGR